MLARKAGQALTSLHKCGLEKAKKKSPTLPRQCINVSSRSEEQTAISQSAHADETHHSFERHFNATVHN